MPAIPASSALSAGFAGVRHFLASFIMKAFALAFALLYSGIFAHAEDALMAGGRSPDGHYAVRIFRLKNADSLDYAIRICSEPRTKPLFTLPDIGGYLEYPGAIEDDCALWHASSQFVAITYRGTRHSTELYILSVYEGGATRLEIPDYVQNALGRVNATCVDQICSTSLKRWDGDDLRVSLAFSAHQRRIYTCEVVLHVSHTGSNSPSVSLKSVSAPAGGLGG